MTELNLTIEDLVEITSSPEFAEIVKQEFDNVTLKRRSRPAPGAGRKYARDWYDRLQAKDMCDYTFIVKNAFDVLTGKSNLNAQERTIVKFISADCIIKTINKFSDGEE